MAIIQITDLPLDCQIKIYQEPTSGCWIWMGSIGPHGYARKRHPKPNPTGNVYGNFHKRLYEITVGPVPDGLELDHVCRVRSCVNPNHLEPVTHAENMRRGERNQYSIKTHCPAGHTYEGDNLKIVMKNGKPTRHCRTCNRASTIRWRTRNGVGQQRAEDASLRCRTYSLNKLDQILTDLSGKRKCERWEENLGTDASGVIVSEAAMRRSAWLRK
jgi:hypothetical protein